LNSRKFDFMDVMLQKLEKYANHLESQVKERTAALEEEKRKTDMLLYRMLPPLVTVATAHMRKTRIKLLFVRCTIFQLITLSGISSK
jgi:nitrate/nitrite-specific signal transduction histidine kinase